MYDPPETKDQNGNAVVVRVTPLTTCNQAAGASTYSLEENKAVIAVAKSQKYKTRYLRFNAYSLESYARIGLPLAFLLFNLGYWVMYAL